MHCAAGAVRLEGSGRYVGVWGATGGERPVRSKTNSIRPDASASLRSNGEARTLRGHVVDADLQSYYDTIPRPPLMEQVRSKVADSKVLTLLEAFPL